MKKVGIWIDHRRAVVVTIENGEESIKTIEGEDDHKRKSMGPQAINEHRVEENYRLHVVNFYKDVIKDIGKPDQLLVMGPAQAKLEFAGEVEKVSELRGVTMKIETADKMTDPQVAAKVRETQF